MTTPRQITFAVAAVAVIATTASCSSSTYDERMAFLRKVANRGVDTYKLLYSQEAPSIDKARCERAYVGSGAGDDAPGDLETGARSLQWDNQIKEFFVDSCVSGKPKPVPGDQPYPSSSTSTPPPTSVTPSPVASTAKP